MFNKIKYYLLLLIIPIAIFGYNNIKSKDTVIIIETERKEHFVIPEDLIVLKEKIYGKTKLLFLN